MRILILEDEIPAQLQIKKLIEKNFPEFEIAGTLNSVISAIGQMIIYMSILGVMEIKKLWLSQIITIKSLN